ncbi:MAG: glycosyltransferase family 4 protein [Candidatus Latescibacterota bacterium]|nr:glycosyltransferase family 4 protein [Candidatus Latescibacterota bacterium]
MRSLVVFAADPLRKYIEKGELKERYWNPHEFFSEIHVISFCDDDVDGEEVRKLVGEANIFVHTVGKPGILNFPLCCYRSKIIVEKIKPDLIRGQGLWHAGSIASFCGHSLSIPTVVSVHTNRDMQRKLYPSIRLRLVQLLEYYTLRRADVLLAVSNYLRDHIRKRGGKLVYTSYNRVYSDQFNHCRDYHIPDRRPKLLTVMRLDHPKDPFTLIKSIESIDVELMIVGQGEFKGELVKLVEELKIADRVHFIDTIPNHKIHHAYSEADIFLMATHFEGFCIPVLEAMASGMPIVTCPTNPIPELVKDTGLIVQQDSNSFKQNIVRLIEDEELRTCLGTMAQKRAKKLDGSVMEKREVDLFKTLMRGNEDEIRNLCENDMGAFSI